MTHPHQGFQHASGHGGPKSPHAEDGTPPLRLVAWETTRRCNLACKHCRAVAEDHPYDNELSTEEAFTLLDQIR
jgi:MoaA/NifB/PqqE/SkfB family radical SAM enzyme